MIIAATIDMLEKVLPPAAAVLGVLIALIVPKFRKGIMESFRAGQRAGGAVAQRPPATDITFHCPACGQKLVVENSSGGASVNCPACPAALVVPMAGPPPMPSGPVNPPVNAGTGRKTGGIILTALGGLMLLAALSNGLHAYNLHSSHDVSKFLGGLGLSALVLTIGLALLAKSGRTPASHGPAGMSGGMRAAIIAGSIIGGVLVLATVLLPVVNAVRARARMMREQLASGKVIAAPDGSVEVTVPFGWSAVSNLHPEARLQVARPGEKEYLEVITDNKRDVPGMTLAQFADRRRAWTVKQLTSPVEHAPTELQVNGHRAIQIVISGICPGREANTAATYLLTCTEDSNRFHEILAWSATSQFDSDRPDLEKITATFKSRSGNTSSATTETHSPGDRQHSVAVPASKPAATSVTHAPPPVESPLIGGAGGGRYRRMSSAGEPVVGFHFALSTWQGKGIVKLLEPLFKQPSGTAADDSVVMARDGYVVGGLEVDGEKYVDALRVIFVRRDGDRIDATDHYESDWIGVATGRPLQQLGGHGEKVVGVYGHKGVNMDAIGLLFAPSKS